MKYLFIGFVILITWIAYEIWRAPLMEETNDGKLITKRPVKKLKDLWRRQQ